jgi:hypothetical protein
MQLLTTKCLNTAVMLMFFLLGKKGIDRALYCDAQKVVERSLQENINNANTMKKLSKLILTKNVKNRYIYYILINDATLSFHGTEPQDTIYFPGHVFVLEKYLHGNGVEYNLYQSYINEYDLKGYYTNRNGNFAMSYDEVKSLLDKLTYIMTNDTWDDLCIKYWKMFTHVDTSKFKNAVQKNKLFICFTHDKVNHCLRNIENYAHEKLKHLQQKDRSEDTKIYGDHSFYSHHAQVTPLTNMEMRANLYDIIQDIKNNKI